MHGITVVQGLGRLIVDSRKTINDVHRTELGFGQISERAHEARGMRNIGSFSTIS